MFSYVKLKNFKSLTDIIIDFRAANRKPKKLVLIYGENGSGKTNIVESFSLLKVLSSTIRNQTALAKFIAQISEKNDGDRQQVVDLFKRHASSYDLDEAFNSVRTQNSSDDIVLEYGFYLDGKEGYYRLVYGEELKEESLYFTLKKNTGYHFKITKGTRPQISNLCITNSDYYNSMNDKIVKFWGKHTFLSIIDHDFELMNEAYMIDSISTSFYSVLKFITQFHIQLKRFDISEGAWATRHSALVNLDEGSIARHDLVELDQKAELVRIVLTSLYSDIKDAYYQHESDDDDKRVHYKLFLKKIIGGVIRDIDFQQESSGTRNLLQMMLPISEAVLGNTAIIDEADTGMHDLLFNNFISRVSEELQGQLILTTHNTTLLKYTDMNAIHFLLVDAMGNKKFVSVADYPVRTQQSHNIQDRYLQGIYGGVPLVGYLDFSEIRNLLEE